MHITKDKITESSRLIPYAKDHDRLQLALLYIDTEIHQDVLDEFEALRKEEETIRQKLEELSEAKGAKILEYMNDIHPGKYVDSSGQKNILGTRGQVNQRRESLIEQHGRDRENIFVMEQSAMNDLAAVLERIKKLEDTHSKLYEHIAQRGEILKSIEELYATAFNGDTPEFPHEDKLELLVEVTEIELKEEQAILDRLGEQDGLIKIQKIANSVECALDDICATVRDLLATFERQYITLPVVFTIKELRRLKIHEKCSVVAERRQEWTNLIDQHLKEYPDFILETIHTLHRMRDLSDLMTEIRDNFRHSKSLVERTLYDMQNLKPTVEKSVTQAKTLLELRRRQLVATRSQILDHVVDPNKCSLEQQTERLPGYPKQKSAEADKSSPSHTSASRLLAQSENYSVEAYVQDIVNSRLRRARRASHPPVLLSARYQPPMYDELNDPELLRRRYQREAPLAKGETPVLVYSGELDDEGRIQAKMSLVIRQELEELVSRAREQLEKSSSGDEKQDHLSKSCASASLRKTGEP
ncbi:unnamed protein product [Rhizoctonia solani]|uniref:Uncharacterized protein n=1 Tax=Rhizoctonia solani TaxID=456999 RepID=A0A8H3B7M3_9AGAM|nr:unnamed protein product [Rhizoctonia solani]